MDGILVNQWNEIILPNSTGPVKIFYADKKLLQVKIIAGFIQQITPDVVYLNGIYSRYYFLNPLRFRRQMVSNDCRFVVCPRGMLQQGALGIKPFKKRVYLAYLKASGLLNTVSWHATNLEESADIKKRFPNTKEIIVAPNVPKAPLGAINFCNKSAGDLKLVYLSLIAVKKNLLFLLQLLGKLPHSISLDIYGPVIDSEYWSTCKQLIAQMPERVRYKGEVEPGRVQGILQSYHVSILPTRGENFSHSLYESLSVGRPVITSFFTPWKQLQQHEAGANVNINDQENCLQALYKYQAMSQEEFNQQCMNAHTIAYNYYSNLNVIDAYKNLF